ncbi:hypothetical protein H6F44_06335 [Pseudanabaena sp. FACHB-1277]|jgi:hypothetical protein|uniref:Uncharacterized protein n=1 Tax=Pseudanabaena cinerea FACHB-1277 TaxID=2949581 RepID=A0A926URF4_9CYAN|nr:Tic20 family protein [Pseudanabaena cinerea]MBD2149744.1 hypothetical protein [Pseudanabaena cinerea FACHB-1277]
MSRRSSVAPLDRLYACLTYLLPITAVVIFGSFLFDQFPQLEILFFPIFILQGILTISILQIIPLRFVAWLCVFLAVVRNYKVNHFIRFNGMQALLLDVVVEIVRVMLMILIKLLGTIAFFPFLFQIISSVTFLGIIAASGYAIWQSVWGKYSEMPVISEVAYMQVR